MYPVPGIPQFLPALWAQIIDILNADVRIPSVIPAPLSIIPVIFFVIPVKTGIQIIRQLRREADTHNISLRFLKFPETSLAGFH